LLKPFLALEEGQLGPPSFGDVTENHHVLAGQAIGFGRVLHENRRAVVSHQFRVALLELLGEEPFPGFLEMAGILVEVD
jgi:hypothetical protein